MIIKENIFNKLSIMFYYYSIFNNYSEGQVFSECNLFSKPYICKNKDELNLKNEENIEIFKNIIQYMIKIYPEYQTNDIIKILLNKLNKSELDKESNTYKNNIEYLKDIKLYDYIIKNNNLNEKDQIKDNKIEGYNTLEDSIIEEKEYIIKNFSQIFPRKNNDIRRCGIIIIKDFVKNNDFTSDIKPETVRKILLVKGKSGFYSFPKGRINDYEDEYDCAIREVYEETGIKISKDLVIHLPILKMENNIYFILNLNNFIINTNNFNNKNEFEYKIEPYNYKIKLIGKIYDYINFWNFNNKNILDVNEVEESEWIEINQMINYKCNKDIRNFLKRAKPFEKIKKEIKIN